MDIAQDKEVGAVFYHARAYSVPYMQQRVLSFEARAHPCAHEHISKCQWHTLPLHQVPTCGMCAHAPYTHAHAVQCAHMPPTVTYLPFNRVHHLCMALGQFTHAGVPNHTVRHAYIVHTL